MTALIVDEAQNLPDALLEEIRLLANVETGSDKLLQIVLTGQPELAGRLNQVSLRQLKQRIALRCVLNPLDKTETGAYIAARIWIASASDLTLFTEEAIDVIYEASQGIPRTISVICDNSLVAGFALGERPIGRDTVLEVCERLRSRARAESGVHQGTDQIGSAGRRRHGPSQDADREADTGTGRGNYESGGHSRFISSLSRASVNTLNRTLTRSDLG